MKKILTVLFTLLLLVINVNGVKADNAHLIVDQSIRETFNEGDEEFIEKDLTYIENNYNIGIYFIFDSSLSDEELVIKANEFIVNHSKNKNNVVLYLNSKAYSLKASGENIDDVLEQKKDIFDIYINTAKNSNYYEGIIAYYQKVVSIINKEAYTPQVPISESFTLVYDSANILSAKEKENLEKNLEEISNKYGMDFVVVTVNSLNGQDIQRYADDFYDYNNYADNGVLFLIDMGSRQITISTRGECINIVDDETIDYIYNDMMSDLKNGNYSKALEIFAKDADKYVYNNQQANTSTSNKHHINFIVSIAVASFASIIVLFILINQLKSVAKEKFARSYVIKNSFNLTGSSNMLVNRRVSKTPIVKNDNRSGGGSSPTSHSSHTSSSGFSHGGHSSSF